VSLAGADGRERLPDPNPFLGLRNPKRRPPAFEMSLQQRISCSMSVISKRRVNGRLRGF
jgi:hypothetical protein